MRWRQWPRSAAAPPGPPPFTCDAPVAPLELYGWILVGQVAAWPLPDVPGVPSNACGATCLRSTTQSPSVVLRMVRRPRSRDIPAWTAVRGPAGVLGQHGQQQRLGQGLP